MNSGLPPGYDPVINRRNISWRLKAVRGRAHSSRNGRLHLAGTSLWCRGGGTAKWLSWSCYTKNGQNVALHCYITGFFLRCESFVSLLQAHFSLKWMVSGFHHIRQHPESSRWKDEGSQGERTRPAQTSSHPPRRNHLTTSMATKDRKYTNISE